MTAVPAKKPTPFAFRATAYYTTSRWLRRRVRVLRYNVLWDDSTGFAAAEDAVQEAQLEAIRV